MPVLRLTTLLLGTCALSGCGSLLTEGTADVAGIAGAGVAAGVTKSATAATAIGVGVTSAAAAGLRYVERDVHGTEQDAIAQVAGRLAPGAVGPWSVHHRIPIEADEHGDVSVSRDFGYGSVACKEVVFSIDTTRHGAPHQDFYITQVCSNAGGPWEWASAEPATPRWGTLQ